LAAGERDEKHSAVEWYGLLYRHGIKDKSKRWLLLAPAAFKLWRNVLASTQCSCQETLLGILIFKEWWRFEWKTLQGKKILLLTEKSSSYISITFVTSERDEKHSAVEWYGLLYRHGSNDKSKRWLLLAPAAFKLWRNVLACTHCPF
jgi:hypothetical protein